MYRLLRQPFRNPGRAEREIAGLIRHLPDAARERLGVLLETSPAPEQGINYCTLMRERQPAAFARLVRSPDGMRHMVGVFTHSRFLSEEILDHPDWIEQLLDAAALQRVATTEDLANSLAASLPPGVPPPVDLARFRRRQILRIMVRDIFAYGTLPEITGELTSLAGVILEVAYQRIYRSLVARYGMPRCGGREAHLTVIALGKMGAEELNYSSDIDLMFVHSGNGNTAGPAVITNKEFFKRAANQLTSLLSAYTAEGMCYRVDLRLRPDGSLGEVSISLDGAKRYYAERARDWELQMLIKARVAGGDRPTGRALLEFVEPLIYSTSTDFRSIEELSATRERINEKLVARHVARKVKTPPLDVKLARGGIRDIEFLVQCLQRLHGGAEPWVQHSGTLLALARLHDKGVLKDADYGRLAAAYQFLRHLEHRLQLEEDRQTHVLPEDPEALEVIARRMPAGGGAAWLREELENHCANVMALYERVVYSGAAAAEETPHPAAAAIQLTSVRGTLDQKAPALAAAYAAAGLDRGASAFEYFLERLANEPRALAAVDGDPALTAAALDLFAHSPFFAEELIRHPQSAVELTRAAEPLIRDEPPPPDPSGLRRWYRRGILRIQAESICRSRPIFDTLAVTSELADAVIAHAYRIAVAEVRAAHPLDGYQPAAQMWIVALGRLGMREFDLGSDADLMFVLPDADLPQLGFWTRVAERLVQLIGAYTGEGVLFTVDTRLRPNGNAGPLVQSESSVAEYFARAAEAWESITYLKSRPVGGDLKPAEDFLHELQQIYWRRYGQEGSSRLDLREMRARLEREQGAARPLKAGRGGYYDIDFLLLYLRLKDAGVFYSVLNTLERIEVLENSEKLGHHDARFLREAATFYRALDHALRILTGHAEGRLPRSEAQIEALNAVLPRWTPIPLADVRRIGEETRTLYNRFFT